MRRYRHELRLKLDDFEFSTDMLRYDSAFNVRFLSEDIIAIDCLGYTPARWESFGVRTFVSVNSIPITEKEYTNLAERSASFINGIKFAQRFASKSKYNQNYRALVEDFTNY